MATLLYILATIIALGGNIKMEECQIYPHSAIITGLDYENDIVTCVDFMGEEWQFEGCEDWFENDIVTMIVYNNMTYEVYDDIILTIKYEGYIE